MVCKFKDVSINEKVSLTTSNSTCETCNTELPGFTADAIYKGHGKHHNAHVDIFEFVPAKACPNCKCGIIQYIERCNEYLLEFSILSYLEVEEPLNKLDYISL